MKKARIVIVGAGFGGLQTAQSLKRLGADVLLINRENYHTFVPMLYQVATGQLEPDQIAYPIRNSIQQSHLRYLMAEVRRVDFENQAVETTDLTIPYDYLVLATGSETQYLGVPGASEHTLPMRTLTEAITLRNHLFTRFEQAAQARDPQVRQSLLTVAIVGGGPTGVELAGAMVEVMRGRLARGYSSLDLRHMRLILLQGGDSLLPGLPQRLSTYTHRKLRRLGVEVHLATRVSRVTSETLHLENYQTLQASTIIWTAGVEAAAPATSMALPRAAKEKLIVQPTLQVCSQPNVYAIGDLAHIENQPLKGVAPEALQQGVAVAQNIKRQLRGLSPQPFRYFNKGRLAIIGCYSGVGKIGPFALTGPLAWVMWLGVHLVYLPGYGNRFLTFLRWIQTYVGRDRPVRLILPMAHRFDIRRERP
ncbi:MAG: NAD(P)/FAD-dependent oxidoreductase [Thermosynechococcaceae cyanobacterium]